MLPARCPVGLKVGVYDDGGLTFRDTDAAGSPLTYCTAPDLTGMSGGGEPWNQAVLAFLQALPADTRIVLYWC